MCFIVNAPYLEDFILWRALSGVSDGRYLDIGAGDPNRDSVSLAFHQQGWLGTHVLRSGESLPRFSEARPADIVLEEGATPDLDTLLGHYTEQSPLHWLRLAWPDRKNLFLLQTWRATATRPWLILIARASQASGPLYEGILETKGYRLIYRDGANDYYAHDSRFESLAPAFQRPPGPGDDCQLSGGHWLARAWALRQQEDAAALQKLRLQLAQATVQVQRLEIRQRDGQAAVQQLEVLKASRSWKLMAPLRWLSWQSHLLKEHGLVGRLQAFLQRLTQRLRQRRSRSMAYDEEKALWSHSPREQCFYEALAEPQTPILKGKDA